MEDKKQKDNIYRITADMQTRIEKALKNGDRVELIPTKDDIKILRVRRNTI